MVSTPTTASQIIEHYGVEPAVFMASPVSERWLFRAAYAADVLKVAEAPIGSNRGPDVERYLAAAGAEPGEPWCAAFGTCMLKDSGVTSDQLPEYPASVHSWADWAMEHELDKDIPARGMAGLMIFTPTEGHFAIVTAIDSKGIHTIEGNTNLDGSREGYGVFRKVRQRHEFHCFVDLTGLKS